ncbi:MAG: slipin family protein [Acidobacteria bacterium]|nr:slipin family protein [Acidobacteriota bacterium]
MTLVIRVSIGDRERILVSRKGRFDSILGPGTHWLTGLGVELERHSVEEAFLVSPWAKFLVHERAELVRSLFHVVETGATEVAMVWRDGKLERIQGPDERTLVWKTAAKFAVEIVNAAEQPVAPRAATPALLKLGTASRTATAMVEEGKCALLFVGSKFVEALSPGVYALWNAVATPSVEVMDLRTQALEISGQEIMTADKVSIRVNLWAEFQVVDPLKVRQSVKSAAEHLYRTLQLAVRQTLAKRSLDEVLSARTDIDDAVAEDVRLQAAKFGIRVGAIAVKDIIPPGEVREILNQVVAAEKKAQANLIARREETAATRSLLNTARLMAEHPLLVRMKELETLEKVAAKVDKIHIHGGTEGLLHKLISIGEG